ncbi:hypothetical protein B0H16DRAFT_1449216 [Mycena metata]|uniref:Uncharacterized protein n=1 Tax=Mycena metata TaxID=1033252 RepID=A0AAD7NVP7_9AGAR|nr:hypothetical protein B0H16DRAFT_1449216 [Mycena metata]
MARRACQRLELRLKTKFEFPSIIEAPGKRFGRVEQAYHERNLKKLKFEMPLMDGSASSAITIVAGGGGGSEARNRMRLRGMGGGGGGEARGVRHVARFLVGMQGRKNTDEARRTPRPSRVMIINTCSTGGSCSAPIVGEWKCDLEGNRKRIDFDSHHPWCLQTTAPPTNNQKRKKRQENEKHPPHALHIGFPSGVLLHNGVSSVPQLTHGTRDDAAPPPPAPLA